MAYEISRNFNNKEVFKTVQSDHVKLIGKIEGKSDVKVITEGEAIIEGAINDSSLLVVAPGAVIQDGEIVNESSVKLVCKDGIVTVKGKTHNSSLTIEAQWDVFLHGDIDDGNLSICSKEGEVIVSNSRIEGKSFVRIIAQENVHFQMGDNETINGKCDVEITSTRGTVTIDGHIDGYSTVRITAFKDINLHEIDGQSSVVARCNGKIKLDGKIDGYSYVDFQAHEGIEITGRVAKSIARLFCMNGPIVLHQGITNDGKVYYSPEESLQLTGEGQDSAIVENSRKVYEKTIMDEGDGSWWNNWFWSYGFVSDNIARPASRNELIKVIQENEGATIKAVGGGWSFSDINLPLISEDEVSHVSVFEKGKGGTVDLRKVYRHFDKIDLSSGKHPDYGLQMDKYPDEVARSLAHSTNYSLSDFSNKVRSGVHLPNISGESRIQIDTRMMKSGLQAELPLSGYVSPTGENVRLFAVEAGITMADLTKLLDHQEPRLAIQASGGSPGATLAGTLSTATHGGEFKDSLLVDRVKAVHLIGPGGEEWWIEGKHRIVQEQVLRNLYGDNLNIVNKDSELEEGLSAEKFLKTVVVSLGAIGIIYSVVLEVVPQFTVRQKTVKYGYCEGVNGWHRLLATAGVTEAQLDQPDIGTNTMLTDFLADGALNGTGIPVADNRYIDLAINPYSKSCWIVNREFFEGVIATNNNQPSLIETYPAGVSGKLSEGAGGGVGGQTSARILDFLSMPSGDRSLAILMATHKNLLSNLSKIVTDSTMLLPSLMSSLQLKAMWNEKNEEDKHRGHKFLDDLLEGILDALQATHETNVSDFTGLSYAVGAIGWPDGGFPGRGFEVALPDEQAFSYLVRMMRIIDHFKNENKVFLGYISIRVCPETETTMGMQQFKRSVMVEIVGHRTPQANEIFDSLTEATKNFDLNPGFNVNPKPIFHWGLETELFDRDYLMQTPLGYSRYDQSGMTKIELFKTVKTHIRNGHRAQFDNAFLRRMGLDG